MVGDTAGHFCKKLHNELTSVPLIWNITLIGVINYSTLIGVSNDSVCSYWFYETIDCNFK